MRREVGKSGKFLVILRLKGAVRPCANPEHNAKHIIKKVKK